jgi:membrane protease YdiL (CAAX protease family)
VLTDQKPEVPKANSSERQPILTERVFLGPDGCLRPILRALLFFLGVMAVQREVGIALYGVLHDAPLETQLYWSSLTLVVALLLVSWIFLRVLDGRSFSLLGLTYRRGWTTQLMGGFALGVGLQLVIAAALLAARAVHFSGGAEFDLLFWKRVLGNGLLFALAAAVEELFFRGYGFQRLIDSIGTGGALLATSALFGFMHLNNPNATFFSTLNTFLAGILLAMPYVRTRRMWMQIGLHWSWNFAMATIVSMPVSGLRFGGSLFRTEDKGPVWLTGGQYGPEGGVVVTIVCLLAIIWFLLTGKLTPSPDTQEDLQ